MSIRAFLLPKHRTQRNRPSLSSQLDDIADYASQVVGDVDLGQLEAQIGLDSDGGPDSAEETYGELNLTPKSHQEVLEYAQQVSPAEDFASAELSPLLPMALCPVFAPLPLARLPVLTPVSDSLSITTSLVRAFLLVFWLLALPGSAREYISRHRKVVLWLLAGVFLSSTLVLALAGQLQRVVVLFHPLVCLLEGFLQADDPFGFCPRKNV